MEQLRQELRSLRNPNQRYQYPPQGNMYNRQTNIQPYRYPSPYPYPYPYPQPYQYPNQQAYPNSNKQVIQNQGQQARDLSLKSLENMRSRGLISEESYLKKENIISSQTGMHKVHLNKPLYYSVIDTPSLVANETMSAFHSVLFLPEPSTSASAVFSKS